MLIYININMVLLLLPYLFCFVLFCFCFYLLRLNIPDGHELTINQALRRVLLKNREKRTIRHGLMKPTTLPMSDSDVCHCLGWAFRMSIELFTQVGFG